MSALEIFLTGLSVVSTVCAVVFGYSTFNARRRKAATDAGHDRGVLLSDIGYIKAGIDDLKREHRETDAKMQVVYQRLTRVEESARIAHKRMDELRIKKSDAV